MICIGVTRSVTLVCCLLVQVQRDTVLRFESCNLFLCHCRDDERADVCRYNKKTKVMGFFFSLVVVLTRRPLYFLLKHVNCDNYTDGFSRGGGNHLEKSLEILRHRLRRKICFLKKCSSFADWRSRARGAVFCELNA